jgi:POT family proton-dependent oligopeptide transporter
MPGLVPGIHVFAPAQRKTWMAGTRPAMTAERVEQGASSPTLFGHPRGLTFLFATEMWERFSYYGMRALLVLYMVKHLLQPGNAEQVIGYATLKAGLEFLFGPLGVQPFASHIYGLYTGLVYLTPLIGGYIADRWLGQRHTVVIGAALMAVGHFMMAFEPLFFLALFVLILGNGAFKPNISTQVGSLYAQGDPRRDRAFAIFYVGVNVGAFFSPLIAGTLGEQVGWHWGFGAAGIGMSIGLATYLYALPALPADALHRARAAAEPRAPLKADERRAVVALLILFVPVTFFWATYEQQGNTIALFASDNTDRTLNLLVTSVQIPVTWFQAFNPFMIFAFTPFVLALWAWQASRKREPSSVTKMAIGCFGVALANLVLVAAAWDFDADGKISWLWLLAFFAVITLGEIYLSPTARIVSMMMGVWLATSFTGNVVSGWLGSYWSVMAKADFFLMIAAIAGAAGLVIWAFNKPLKPALGG